MSIPLWQIMITKVDGQETFIRLLYSQRTNEASKLSHLWESVAEHQQQWVRATPRRFVRVYTRVWQSVRWPENMRYVM
jgi:hypothetical protein